MEETLDGVEEPYMFEDTPTVLTLPGEIGVLPGSSLRALTETMVLLHLFAFFSFVN